MERNELICKFILYNINVLEGGERRGSKGGEERGKREKKKSDERLKGMSRERWEEERDWRKRRGGRGKEKWGDRWME